MGSNGEVMGPAARWFGKITSIPVDPGFRHDSRTCGSTPSRVEWSAQTGPQQLGRVLSPALNSLRLTDSRRSSTDDRMNQDAVSSKWNQMKTISHTEVTEANFHVIWICANLDQTGYLTRQMWNLRWQHTLTRRNTFFFINNIEQKYLTNITNGLNT